MNAGIRVGKVVMFLLAGVLLSSIMGSTLFYWTGATVPQFPVGSGSWNARVPCSSPWIVRITDITANMSGSASQTSSIFNPGSPNKKCLTPGSTLIDVQGFVYWDPDHLTAQWHSFNGWEIHPLTAWRQHETNQAPDFSISSNPSSPSVPPGESGTSTITLTSLGSFAGTVTLSPSISPNGPAVSVNPTSVTLVAGGSGTSKLTVSTYSSTPLGDYTVTVAGKSDSLYHSSVVM